ncbi:MAG: ethanolamine utilization protein EutN [Spirochaetes bacterium]|nr:MAG: ethanolamine utilization protein EutN [Spirochaetota bacterium]
MIFGKVAGTIVSTQRSDQIEGAKYLLVELCDQKGNGKKSYLVALDPLQAGEGEMVILSQGSSCRQTQLTYQKPIDTLIVGIVDMVEERGQVAYRK